MARLPGLALAALSLLLTAAASEPAPVIVVIRNSAYDPPTLAIRPGTTVRWVNDDSTPHSVTIGDQFQSPVLATGETAEWVFTHEGRFFYGCALHRAMRAVVTVTKD